MVTLDEFTPDQPWVADGNQQLCLPTRIEGVSATNLEVHRDNRGGLCELLTLRNLEIAPIVHVYSVTALPGSVRAWVYHKRQWDRLAYTQGHFRVVLYDIRPESRSHEMMDILEIGCEAPTLLFIPPYVVHGVMNIGDQDASFINMPTNIYDPDNPDKMRLPADHPGIPYSFLD